MQPWCFKNMSLLEKGETRNSPLFDSTGSPNAGGWAVF
jgi:hypothetical protein